MEAEAIEPYASGIDRREWLRVIGWSAVILIITSLPYLFGALISSPDAQFGGLVIGVEDGNSYLAKMRLGATGAWQFYLFYTTEPHQGAYLLLFHLLLGKVARLSGLSFDIGKSDIKDDHVPLLEKIKKVIQMFPDAQLVVEGRTDASGDPKANLTLSEKRAYAVMQYLRQSLLISADKIQAIGYGADKPIASNQTKDGRAKNRRIDVIIMQ